MTEPRTRAEKRLTRARAWQQLLVDHREHWVGLWGAWCPQRGAVLALLEEALLDAEEEIAVAKAEADAEERWR